jgi:uncharacterized membrane protein YdjX (TVP38/TMEM64 family)
MKLFRSSRFWLGIGFIVLLIALRYSGFGDYVTLNAVREKRELLAQFVMAHYGWAVLMYMLWYVVIVTLALPLTALSTVVGGFFFGTIPAVIYTNIGATVGATSFFLLVRYLWRDIVQKQYQHRLVWFNAQVKLHGAYYLISMRFLAFIPFFVENLLAGLSEVSAWTFAWTTSVGIIPGSLVYAFAGKQFTTINSIRDIFSFNIVLAFALLALLALVPIFVQRYRNGSWY